MISISIAMLLRDENADPAGSSPKRAVEINVPAEPPPILVPDVDRFPGGNLNHQNLPFIDAHGATHIVRLDADDRIVCTVNHLRYEVRADDDVLQGIVCTMMQGISGTEPENASCHRGIVDVQLHRKEDVVYISFDGMSASVSMDECVRMIDGIFQGQAAGHMQPIPLSLTINSSRRNQSMFSRALESILSQSRAVDIDESGQYRIRLVFVPSQHSTVSVP